MTYTGQDFLNTVMATLYEGVTHAGVAVVAADTGRVLLTQRTMDDSDDPDVQETWEFPGGGLEDGEDPQAGAFREFAEEVEDVGLADFAEVVDGWRSEDGVYQGFVAVVPDEGLTHGEEPVEWFRPNDEVQAVAWFSRQDIDASDNLRPEMRDTDWDMIFGSVSGNEDDMEDEMMDEPEWDALLASVGPIPVHGVLAPEETPTGDQRGFAAGSITSRPLRLPFSWQKSAIGGHDGSVVVGSVDRLMRKDGLVHWEGNLMPSAETDEFIAVMEFFNGRFGVSVDGDKGSLDMDRSEADNMAWFDAVRASGLTGVAIPAFHEAYVAFGNSDMPEALTASLTNAGMVTGARVTFDRGPGWFTNPKETNRIHDYWTKKGQPGYAKIAWGTPGDFRRAKALIGEKIAKNSPDKMKYLNQIIAQWHHDALGYWPGDLDKPGNKTTAEARAERKAKVAAGTVSGEVGLRDDDAVLYDLAEALADVDGLEPVDESDLEEGETTEWEAVLVSSVAGGKQRPNAAYFDRHPDTDALSIEDPDAFGFIRVHGYAAERGVCHIGFEGRCVEPPIDESGAFADFHLGRTRVAGGEFINTGVLTYNVGHRDATTILSETATQAHFDDLRNAWAAVRLGVDDRGIWFSGVVLPKMDEDDLTLIEASGQVSGEWKKGALRALLTVNTPGFPVMRASAVFDDDGEVVSLAASAFTNTLTAAINEVADSPCAVTAKERIDALRVIDAEERFDEMKARFAGETI